MSSRVSRGALRKRRSGATEVKVGIIGLDRITGSLSLALRAYSDQPSSSVVFNVVGYDSDKEVAKMALDNNIIDNVQRDMGSTVNDASIVVLKQPLTELAVVFRKIGSQLKDGAVVIDLSMLKRPAVDLAAKHFNKDLDGDPKAFLVGATPMISFAHIYSDKLGVDGADEHLFAGSEMLVVPAAKVPPEAVKVVTDIAGFLDLTPRFMDPLEHDGLASMTDGIPLVLSMLYLQTVQQSPGKLDLERSANANFATMLQNLRQTSPTDIALMWQSNKTALLKHIETLMQNLESLYQTLRTDLDNPDILTAYLEALMKHFVAWEVRREQNRWDEPADSLVEGVQATGLSLFGTGPSVRQKTDDDK